MFTHAGWPVGTQKPHRTISGVSWMNEHSPSQQRHMFPALGSPSRDDRVRHARSSTDDCGGRHLGGTKAWTKAPGATVADRKPLTDRIPVPLMRPLLGNKGVHSINGNVNNLGSTLNEKNTWISTRKPPMYKCPCKACGKPVKSNQYGIFCDGCDRTYGLTDDAYTCRRRSTTKDSIASIYYNIISLVRPPESARPARWNLPPPLLFGRHVPFRGKHYLTPWLPAGGKPSSLSGVCTVLIYKWFYLLIWQTRCWLFSVVFAKCLVTEMSCYRNACYTKMSITNVSFTKMSWIRFK